jgi:Zn-dependent protease
MSRNGLLLLGGWLLSGAALVFAPPILTGVLTFLFVMLGWVVALAVHEFGHAVVAWRAGDHTVVTRGYLTFDPLRYADFATSVVIPVIVLAIGGIALPGGAVYLRPDLMRSRVWRSASSLAGPTGTLLVLILLALVLVLGGPQPWFARVAPGLALLAMFQAMALIFNLLPVPGLDGYGVIRPFLSPILQAKIAPFEQIAVFGLIAVVFFLPGASAPLFQGALALTELLGVDRQQVGLGYILFHFWEPGGAG